MSHSFRDDNKALATLWLSLLIWLLFYWQTLWSMVEIWWRSETFAHGFLIFPISIYLIWREKERYYGIDKKFSPFFALILLGLVFIWALARAVDVQVVQQLMVILMIPTIVGALFGFKLLKQYLFPLVYLIFAVPFGEFLVPRLQEVTAIMTVWGLRLSGIPVFTEGMFISIPAGDFEVAVACSGIRYLIASFVLGLLYAYLTYSKLYKKILFVIASLVAPVIANGIRAYGIVMIAHLSDMQYATGIDHLIYGWLFFGVVIFILFWVGSYWRDEEETPVSRIESVVTYQMSLSGKVIPGIILAIGPVMMLWMNYQPEIDSKKISPPAVMAPWVETQQSPENWQPVFQNADSEVLTTYRQTETQEAVYFYASNYLYESQDKELVNAMNQSFSTRNWLMVSSKLIKPLGYALKQEMVRNDSGKLMIWSWYEVMGFKLTHPITIKIVQAFGKLTGKSRGGQFKAIAIPFDENPEDAKKRLKGFLSSNPHVLKETE